MDRKPPAEPEEHKSLTRATVSGVFWLTLSRGLKAPLNLIAIAVLARILSPADFGILALGVVVSSFSDMLIDGSFSMVLIQRREINPRLIGATFILSAGLAAVFAAGVIIAAPMIERQFDFAQLRQVLIFLAAILPITAITTVTTALLQRGHQFKILTINALVAQIAYTVAGIGLAFAGMGLWALVWAQMLQWVVEATLGMFAVRKRFEVKLSISGMGDVFHSGGMFTASKMLKWAANSVDRVIIGRLLGAADLGFYSRATTLMRSARQLGGAGPMRVLFSSFAKMQHDPARMLRAYNRSLSVSLILSSLVSAFVVVNAELIVRVLLGPKWLDAIPVIQILFIGFFPKAGAVVAEAVPLALGLGGASALREGAQLALVAIGATIGAQFGIVGAAIGVCAAYWLFYFICMLLVRRLLHAGWGEQLRLHLNAVAVAIPPVALALATRLLIPADTILTEFIVASVFGIAALLVVAAAPAVLVSDDIVKARAQVRDRLLPFVPGVRRSA